LPYLLHIDKCNGDGDNTGNGVGDDIAGDKVGNGKGDKGNCHQCCCRCCRRPHLSLLPQPSSSLLLTPQLPNTVALSAAIAAAVAIAHLFDIAIKWR
jgi:hypothetical protein